MYALGQSRIKAYSIVEGTETSRRRSRMFPIAKSDLRSFRLEPITANFSGTETARSVRSTMWLTGLTS